MFIQVKRHVFYTSKALPLYYKINTFSMYYQPIPLTKSSIPEMQKDISSPPITKILFQNLPP